MILRLTTDMLRLIICSVFGRTSYDVRERRTDASREIFCIHLKVGEQGGCFRADVQSYFECMGADSLISSCDLFDQICA
jgi:hypothetical protein